MGQNSSSNSKASKPQLKPQPNPSPQSTPKKDSKDIPEAELQRRQLGLQSFDPAKGQSCLPKEAAAAMREQEDPIQEYVKRQGSDVAAVDLAKCIHLSASSNRQSFSISSKESQVFPVMVTLSTEGGLQQEDQRAPIDIVCVIDDSGSMSGQKAKLVRKSLKYLIKVLKEKDRICLVSFDDHAKVMIPFLRVNADNKERIKAAINDIKGRGGTCVHAGMESALWMLQNRKQQNPVSCVFLLTDGVDNNPNADVRVEALMQKYTVPAKYTINCYGYGNDHDPEVLNRIARVGEGGFYYIENLKQISDYFILSISGLLNVLVQDVRVRVMGADSFDIIKRYGDASVWSKDNELHLPLLVQGESKSYFLEVELPRSKRQVNDLQRQAKVLTLELRAQDLQKKDFFIEAALTLTAFNEGEKGHDGDEPQAPREDFEVGYLRAKGGVVISEACELAKAGKYPEGQKMLQDVINSVQASPFREHKHLVSLAKDLRESLEVCQPRIFEQKGKAFMYKKGQDHVQRRASICDKADWNE